MDRQEISRFVLHYQHMNESVLVDLHSRIGTLTEEAQEALKGVIAGRGIDVAKLNAEHAAEDIASEQAQIAKAERKERRNGKLFKIYLIVFIPLALISAVFRPQRAFETFVSSAAQGLLLGVVFVIYWGIRRFLTKSK